MIYGGDYNPEQWPREVWREDARLMREAGVNLVSLGIFSWAWLEPREGQFEFGWLDEVMDLLHAHGVGVNLATATASPPPWLSARYPDSKPLTDTGVRLEVGGRQLYCPSHPQFRALARRLVREIATRYREHPALRMWHVNNEFGCHIDTCYCDLCAGRFRAWLRAKYGNLESLNEAWGTAFWSQRYGDWDEIQPPRKAPTYANPAQQLDWRRFSSDNILELYQNEVEVLRELTPTVPVTTNFLGFLRGLDYVRWAREEDVVSLDAYPDPSQPRSYLEAAMQFDLVRSLRGGQRWILMEQATGAVNWRARNAIKRPGVARLFNHLALAHGASGIMFFQWRASKAGAEKFHSGMVQHVGPERSRIWRETRDFGAELKTLADLSGFEVPAPVALLFDWENWWALEIDSKPSEDVRMMPLAFKWYAALRRLGVNVDLVHPEADLSAYRAVVAPNQYLLTERAAHKLRAFVQGGGSLTLGFFSGIVNAFEQIQLGGYPALLSDVLGLWVEEWAPLQPEERQQVRFADGHESEAAIWSEVVHLEGAEALATFGRDYLAGGPAVTRHAFGQGRAYYLATDLPEDEVRDLLRRALEEAGVAVAPLPGGLDVTVSRRGDESVLHLLNFDAERSFSVRVPPGGRSFPEGAELAEELRLEPGAVRLIRYSGPLEVSQLRFG
nr:beta-galactosidase [Deinobacterium chartae]